MLPFAFKQSTRLRRCFRIHEIPYIADCRRPSSYTSQRRAGRSIWPSLTQNPLSVRVRRSGDPSATGRRSGSTSTVDAGSITNIHRLTAVGKRFVLQSDRDWPRWPDIVSHPREKMCVVSSSNTPPTLICAVWTNSSYSVMWNPIRMPDTLVPSYFLLETSLGVAPAAPAGNVS